MALVSRGDEKSVPSKRDEGHPVRRICYALLHAAPHIRVDFSSFLRVALAIFVLTHQPTVLLSFPKALI